MEKLEIPLSEVFYANHSYFQKVDILKLGIQMVKNVRELHSIGYVHLDLKLDNLMFDTEFER